MKSRYKRINEMICTFDYVEVCKFLSVKGHQKARFLRQLNRTINYYDWLYQYKYADYEKLKKEYENDVQQKEDY